MAKHLIRRVRQDANITAVERSIECNMDLPEGSVRLVLPKGRKARNDMPVASLRRSYAKATARAEQKALRRRAREMTQAE